MADKHLNRGTIRCGGTMKKIEIQNYPLNLTFKVKVILPKFQQGEPTRNKLLHRQLQKLFQRGKLNDLPHSVTEFFVDSIEKTDDGEIWVIL